MAQKINMDDFDDKYNGDPTIKSVNFDQDGTQAGMLETFGEDLETLNNHIKHHDDKRVWANIGESFIPGTNCFDAVYFIITKEEWNSADEEYFFDENKE